LKAPLIESGRCANGFASSPNDNELHLRLTWLDIEAVVYWLVRASRGWQPHSCFRSVHLSPQFQPDQYAHAFASSRNGNELHCRAVWFGIPVAQHGIV